MSLLFRFGRVSGGEPMPTLPIQLVDELTGFVTSEMIAIVDTGADGTIIPFDRLQEAGFRPNRQRRRLFTVESSQPEEVLYGYSVNVRIDELELAEVDVYGSRRVLEAVVGRDILNRLIFNYDGPNQVLELSDPNE